MEKLQRTGRGCLGHWGGKGVWAQGAKGLGVGALGVSEDWQGV